MDLRALRYFVAAVNEGSISAAALSCHVAQPSITLAVNKLEEQLGHTLLHRHHKGVTTSPKGLELYHLASELLQHAKAVESKLKENKAPLKLTIGLDHSIQISYVERLIKACKEITQSTFQDIVFEVVSHEEKADIQICTHTSANKKAPFFPIATENYALLIPLSNQLAFKNKLSLKDLDGQAIIERYHCENRALFDKLVEHFDLKLSIAARVDNEEWALSLVAAGLGISISPITECTDDTRFKIRYLSELIDMDTPERQIGISFNANPATNIQSVLNQLSHHLTKTKYSPFADKAFK